MTFEYKSFFIGYMTAQLARLIVALIRGPRDRAATVSNKR